MASIERKLLIIPANSSDWRSWSWLAERVLASWPMTLRLAVLLGTVVVGLAIAWVLVIA